MTPHETRIEFTNHAIARWCQRLALPWDAATAMAMVRESRPARCKEMQRMREANLSLRKNYTNQNRDLYRISDGIVFVCAVKGSHLAVVTVFRYPRLLQKRGDKPK